MSQVSTVRGPVEVADLRLRRAHGALPGRGLLYRLDRPERAAVPASLALPAQATATSYSVALAVLAVAAGLVGGWWVVRA
jgi:hypothetical protein